ncbi:MAG: 16S rRNA (uracil(1498)-N(3))-methyltransferase [Granulosicoccus sp.]|nr:16S rRNA (uracil(1498)-N(3))-methyltransferase [Granulosicoccus sp.]
MLKSERTARITRIHFNGELRENSELNLPRDASHHLITVLRTRQGDVIDLFNGDGLNYRATVMDTGLRSSGKRALLQVHRSTAANTESPVDITLVQGISRGDRMDTTLRQSVELGVTHLQPIHTRHSAPELDERRRAKKVQHWQSIVVSASEQSGRAALATLAPPISLKQWLSDVAVSGKAGPTRYVLAPTAEHSLRSGLDNCAKSASGRPAANSGKPGIVLIIGPESGLDADEIEQVVHSGARAVSVGPRILRTETAGPACIALAQAILGDLG